MAFALRSFGCDTGGGHNFPGAALATNGAWIRGWWIVGGIAFAWVTGLRAEIPAGGDSDDSPLYAASRERTFVDMNARDTVPAQSGTGAVSAGTIIVAEGTSWHRMSGTEGRPRPLGVTMMPPTCGERTCVSYPTCAGNTTCTDAATCNNTCTFFPTCLGAPPSATCNIPTCNGPTCANTFTCNPYNSVTCVLPTCTGSTCGNPTCVGTCYPASCPTTLFNVNLPASGQIQFSFSSSLQLIYVLQCCTNFGAEVWCDVCSSNGNGAVLTLCHTNGAPAAFYRLIIQRP